MIPDFAWKSKNVKHTQIQTCFVLQVLRSLDAPVRMICKNVFNEILLKLDLEQKIPYRLFGLRSIGLLRLIEISYFFLCLRFGSVIKSE